MIFPWPLHTALVIIIIKYPSFYPLLFATVIKIFRAVKVTQISDHWYDKYYNIIIVNVKIKKFVRLVSKIVRLLVQDKKYDKLVDFVFSRINFTQNNNSL